MGYVNERGGIWGKPSQLVRFWRVHVTNWPGRTYIKESIMEDVQQKTGSSGFASMDAHKQREIARKGGMAAHRKGRLTSLRLMKPGMPGARAGSR